MLLAGDSPWFDNVNTTDRVETLANTLAVAAEGVNMNAPDWGERHQLRFISPLRQSGYGSDFLGGGTYPMPGSGETIRRARYGFNRPYDVAFFASFNMVADLAETDELQAALPGGVAARQFHRHYRNLIADWYAGTPIRMPISPAAAAQNARSRLNLEPAPPPG